MVLFAFTHPTDGVQESEVQGLPSSQSTADPGTHAPAAQVSPEVHALPSVQASEFGALMQPACGVQLSVVHGFESLQFTTCPGWQVPPVHWSWEVHALPSEHGSVLLALTQPVAGLQESEVHGLPSSQLTA
jgi:hypothetical protein